MYTIDNCEKENKNTTLELFKKINNNLQLKDCDFPKILALQIVEAFIKNKELVPNLKIIKRYEKAKKYDFWLNLKSSPKCKPTEWIKYIANPNDFNP